MKPANILVIEDNPITRKMLRVTLESEGYSVNDVPDGRTALAFAREHVPDLVLHDLILPDMDGFQLVRELRAMPGLRDVPIVALSGFASRLEEARATSVGFTALLLKPVEPSRLVESIAALLPSTEHRRSPLAAGQHVLVVDDDPVFLKLVRVHLTKRGFVVTTASNGAEAIEAAATNVPDLVLSDTQMPGMDGFELCYALRNDPALARVSVVLTSGHPYTTADNELANRVGASGFITKTPEFEGLTKKLLECAAAPPGTARDAPTERLRLENARAVIEQLSRQLSINSGLARRCTLQAAQLSLLGGIANALSRRTDVDVVLRDVLAATLDAAAISKGAVFLRDAKGVLRLRHAIGFDSTEREGLSSFFGEASFLERALEHDSAVSIPDEGGRYDPRLVALLQNAGVARLHVVPLANEVRSLGAIVLGANGTDVTSEDSVAFARAIANQLVQSLELEASFSRLAASEKRYRTLMESANDAIAVITPEGVILECNDRTAEILGTPKEAVVGQHIRVFAPPGKEQETVDTFQVTSAIPGRQSPAEVKRADGSVFYIEFSATPVDLDGQNVIFTIGRDVTEQVRTHAQLIVSDRMASIGTLAAGVAHEINNPLSAVIMNLELIARDFGNLQRKLGHTVDFGDVDEEIRDAREASERVRNIVRDLKIFSRVEEEATAPVDVQRVLESTSRLAWNEIRHRARLVKDYGRVPLVLGNEGRLGQVFLNLLVNAAQAINEGHADANEIRVRTSLDETERVVVEISDTGTGMSQKTLQKLFTPFFTTKPQGIGTGLGLDICHRIITTSGGDITVESKLGTGTTFRISLPLARADVPVSNATRTQADAPPVRRARMLIIDDERVVGSAVKRLFKNDHDVTLLTSAQVALDHVKAGARFDVLLCDLMMPIMTGMELYAALKETVPDQAERIVFLTGGAFTPRARAFLDEIPNARLEKPFEAQTLVAIVNERLK
ncbi:MAG TPA: response regulator [Polyangiaceae bacterium]|nr:response regulator [Polyangiaceae bacterium]